MAKLTTNLLPLFTLTTLLLLLLSATQASATQASATLVSTILSSLGYATLSSAATNLTYDTPITIFAPTLSSLSTCPSCSLPLLLEQHTLPGLYPLGYLQSLPFGTKIETLSPNHCLTVTSSSTIPAKVFINGNEITKPDLFNNGFIIVHSIRAYAAHLSPSSCQVQAMTTLSFPDQPPPLANSSAPTMRQMLKYAMSKLRSNGCIIVSMALSVREPELARLESMTLFAIDDDSIFVGGEQGYAYVADLGFHIVPNRTIKREDLVAMKSGTAFPSLDEERSVVVTTVGDGSPLRPVRINYKRISKFDIVNNERIVVHGLSMPFHHVDWSMDTVDRQSIAKGLAGNVAVSFISKYVPTWVIVLCLVLFFIGYLIFQCISGPTVPVLVQGWRTGGLKEFIRLLKEGEGVAGNIDNPTPAVLDTVNPPITSSTDASVSISPVSPKDTVSVSAESSKLESSTDTVPVSPSDTAL